MEAFGRLLSTGLVVRMIVVCCGLIARSVEDRFGLL